MCLHTADEPEIRVVKLGGSLLEWPRIGDAFRQWIATQQRMRTVVIAGGGSLVDDLRRLDRLLSLDPVLVHFLAIDLMDVTGRLIHSLLPESRLATSLAEVRSGRSDELVVFAPAGFLREEEAEHPGDALPCGWSVTSDSITARIAGILAAAELVLLKSRPSGIAKGDTPDWHRLAEDGYVDAAFPRFAPQCHRIRPVDLRSGGPWLALDDV